MRSRVVVAIIGVALLVAPLSPAAAGPAFPDSVPVPDGFYPEGIAVGFGHTFYVGSLLDGAIYQGDLRSGAGELLAEGVDGRVVAGLWFDRRSRLLWGVGFQGMDARAFVFDTRTGESVEVPIPGVFPSHFPNDVVVTRDAAYITDSFSDVLWTVEIDAHGQPVGAAEALPLTGEFDFVGFDDVPPGAFPVNLNGIEAAPNGRHLIANHTTLGTLYRIDPGTGHATEIDLGGDAVPSGDGIVLAGRTLYVVQNFLNQVAVVELAPDLSAGGVVDVITSDLFRVPTTAAISGNRLHLINGRFDVDFPPFLDGTVEDPPLEYEVVTVPRR